MTEAGLVLSDRFAFRSLGAVASLDDFGRDADSAFALARSTFGHAETEEETVRHLIGDYVTLATDLETLINRSQQLDPADCTDGDVCHILGPSSPGLNARTPESWRRTMKR